MVINGDCLVEMQNIPDGSIDMILCDLPYGTTRNKWDNIIPMAQLWEQYKRIVKPNGAILLFADGMFMANLMTNCPKGYWRYNLVWVKNKFSDFLNAGIKPLKKHEEIVVFYGKKPTYNPQMRGGNPYRAHSAANTTNYGKHKDVVTINNGTRKPTTVLNFALDVNKLHPTQKPVALCEWLIKTYTNEGDTVLDNCMGSGSVGVACKRTNRKFIGIELDKTYFEIAKNRIGNE